MVCHGELVRLKPGPRHLTSFYLMIAGGGSLGGFLVTVIAPRVLRGYFEYHLGLLATGLLALVVLIRDRSGALYQGRRAAAYALWVSMAVAWFFVGFLVYGRIWQYRNFYLGLSIVILVTLGCLWADSRRLTLFGHPVRVWTVWTALVAGWYVLALVLVTNIEQSIGRSVETSRNFFGVLRVRELYKGDPEEHSLSLMHGRIEHGFQFQDPGKRHWRTSYYGPTSGIGLAIGFHPRRLEGDSLRIGVIGLGAGALTAWGEPGDYIRFYEINPEVLRLSEKYFTYRRDSPAHSDVVLGDARISLERERQAGESEQFDVLAVDAFTGDAIPVHLLTRECAQDYLYHLKEDGILAIHITNRYFDLGPIVRNLVVAGTHPEMQAVWIHDLGNMTQSTDRTDWVLLTANARFLANRNIQQSVTSWPDPVPPPKFWTDDYSDLFTLVHERINDR